MQPIPAKQGGTGASSLSAALDAAFGSTQGSVLYRGASGWAALGPGNSGQVLQTAGSGANPSWANMAVTTAGVTTSGSPAAGQFAMFTSASAIGTATAGPNTVLAGPASGTASGTVTARALVPADIPAPADGCCRVSVASTTNLKLSPYGGNTLWIGGQACTIPAAGVTLSGPSVAASTLYYLYATASGGAVTALALSTTGHITGSDGREYLSSGGSTPSAVTSSRLVGMVFTNTSGQFAVTATFMGLLNWFNRQTLALASAINAATASTSATGLNGGLTFLTWSTEAVDVCLTGFGAGNSAGTVGTVTNYLDAAQNGPLSQFYSAVANAPGGLAACFAGGIAEGAHTVQAVGYSNSTSYTATFQVTQTVKVRG